MFYRLARRYQFPTAPSSKEVVEGTSSQDVREEAPTKRKSSLVTRGKKRKMEEDPDQCSGTAPKVGVTAMFPKKIRF